MATDLKFIILAFEIAFVLVFKLLESAMSESIFPVNRFNDIQNAPADFKMLERIPLTRPDILSRLPVQFEEVSKQEQLCPLVFASINTSGIDVSKEFIIELALVRCTYSISRRTVVSVDYYYHEYEDPRFQLSEDVQRYTHVTNQMIKDRSFDESQVRRILADSPLVIAFKPEMVRPFFERRFPIFADLSWGSASVDVPWRELGIKGSRLPYITTDHGYYYDFNSAGEQALTMSYIMYCRPEALESILNVATMSSYRIELKNFPRESKDKIKALGFRWDSDKRLWAFLAKTKNDLDMLWQELINIEPNYNNAIVYQITARERFKVSS